MFGAILFLLGAMFCYVGASAVEHGTVVLLCALGGIFAGLGLAVAAYESGRASRGSGP